MQEAKKYFVGKKEKKKKKGIFGYYSLTKIIQK